MKNYDLNQKNGKHIIKITLQCDDYKGHIEKEIYGNCKGLSILSDLSFECDDFEECRNDCNLTYDEDYDVYSCILKNEQGDCLEIEGEYQDMDDMVVCIEIVEFKVGD